MEKQLLLVLFYRKAAPSRQVCSPLNQSGWRVSTWKSAPVYPSRHVILTSTAVAHAGARGAGRVRTDIASTDHRVLDQNAEVLVGDHMPMFEQLVCLRRALRFLDLERLWFVCVLGHRRRGATGAEMREGVSHLEPFRDRLLLVRESVGGDHRAIHYAQRDGANELFRWVVASDYHARCQ